MARGGADRVGIGGAARALAPSLVPCAQTPPAPGHPRSLARCASGSAALAGGETLAPSARRHYSSLPTPHRAESDSAAQTAHHPLPTESSSAAPAASTPSFPARFGSAAAPPPSSAAPRCSRATGRTTPVRSSVPAAVRLQWGSRAGHPAGLAARYSDG